MTIPAAQHERTIANIVETDRAEAQAAAQARYIADAVELAPLSLADARALGSGLGAALAGLAEHLIRPQAVRFLVERGQPWGWGDVDTTEARIRAKIAEARAAQLAARIGQAQAAALSRMARGEQPAPAEPTTTPAEPADWIDLDTLVVELDAMDAQLYSVFAARFGLPWKAKPTAKALRRTGWTRAMVDAAWAWINARYDEEDALDGWDQLRASRAA